jgi:hypothetical protein
MYIGNGKMGAREPPGKPVKLDPIDQMPYVGAVRAGLTPQPLT